MNNPIVSFVVPCYKLAHLLEECVNSILSQSFHDLEVLIMNDCSPDNTAEVAQSFQDPRVKHIRNDPNLGHLRNYNKGISLTRGKYVWLISADDRLRRPYVLERYVQLLDDHPEVGYVFCPGVGLHDGIETTLLDEYYYGAVDKIFDGRQFIATVLRKGGGLLSPSVMVRKDCYDKISMFPLDMPNQGDMYLWFIWALEYDVAYLSEAMVNYRSHDLNMMKDLLTRVPKIVFTDEVNVMWRTKRQSEQKGFYELACQIEYYIASHYAHAVALAIYGERSESCAMSITQCDEALRTNALTLSEYRRLRGKFYASVADKHWWHGAFQIARQNYALALWTNWRMPEVWLKLLFALMGRVGRNARIYIQQRKYRLKRSCELSTSSL
ncbi:MAG: glycosyltransferase family 2 protein [Methylobacter sp.]